MNLLGLHFDGTVNVANVAAFLVGLIAVILAWRDLNWRMRNVETWKKGHEDMSTHAMETLSELRTVTQELKVIAEGQDRRLRLLEKLS